MENTKQSPTPLHLLDLEVTITQSLNNNIFSRQGAPGLLQIVDALTFDLRPPEIQEYWLKEDLTPLLLQKEINATIQMKAVAPHPEKLAGSFFSMGTGDTDVCRLQVTIAEKYEEADFSLLGKEDGFRYRWLPKVIPWGEKPADKDSTEEDEKEKKGESEEFVSPKVLTFPRREKPDFVWVKVPYPFFPSQPQMKESAPKSSLEKEDNGINQALGTQFTELKMKFLEAFNDKNEEKDQDIIEECKTLCEVMRLVRERLEKLKAKTFTKAAETVSLSLELQGHGPVTEESLEKIEKLKKLLGRED